jgi:hypothetical protein
MMDEHGWTPADFNALSVPMLHALYGDHDGGPRHWSAAEQLAEINAVRAKAGLPPIPPRQRR